MTKKCYSCGIEKPITQFSPTSPYKGQPRFRGDCKECNAANQIRRYHLNPEKSRATARIWKTNNPQKVIDNKRWNEYRLRPGDFEKLVQDQDGKCAICGDDLKFPHIDHCHATGKVRGILCSACNTGLGKLGDSVESLKRAVRYLENFSSSQK